MVKQRMYHTWSRYFVINGRLLIFEAVFNSSARAHTHTHSPLIFFPPCVIMKGNCCRSSSQINSFRSVPSPSSRKLLIYWTPLPVHAARICPRNSRGNYPFRPEMGSFVDFTFNWITTRCSPDRNFEYKFFSRQLNGGNRCFRLEMLRCS